MLMPRVERQRQRERHKGERDVAEENIKLILVEVHNRAEEDGGDERGNKDAPAGKEPEREHDMKCGEEKQKRVLRESHIFNKRRNIAEPVVWIGPETIRDIQE